MAGDEFRHAFLADHLQPYLELLAMTLDLADATVADSATVLQSLDGQAMTGHHDRLGLVSDAWALSWNSSHLSRGCGQEALERAGGVGLFHCLAAD